MPHTRPFQSLTFRIVAAALASVMAVMGTAAIVLKVTQGQVQEMLLSNDREDITNHAGLLASKLDTLRNSLLVVLLPQCPIPQALAIADKLRAAVESYRLLREGQSHSVGASIGLVAVNGSHAGAAEVLRAADAACYEAKRLGRNQVALAE